jgi:hypothetical protein
MATVTSGGGIAGAACTWPRLHPAVAKTNNSNGNIAYPTFKTLPSEVFILIPNPVATRFCLI